MLFETGRHKSQRNENSFAACDETIQLPIPDFLVAKGRCQMDSPFPVRIFTRLFEGGGEVDSFFADHGSASEMESRRFCWSCQEIDRGRSRCSSGHFGSHPDLYFLLIPSGMLISLKPLSLRASICLRLLSTPMQRMSPPTWPRFCYHLIIFPSSQAMRRFSLSSRQLWVRWEYFQLKVQCQWIVPPRSSLYFCHLCLKAEDPFSLYFFAFSTIPSSLYPHFFIPPCKVIWKRILPCPQNLDLSYQSSVCIFGNSSCASSIDSSKKARLSFLFCLSPFSLIIFRFLIFSNFLNLKVLSELSLLDRELSSSSSLWQTKLITHRLLIPFSKKRKPASLSVLFLWRESRRFVIRKLRIDLCACYI